MTIECPAKNATFVSLSSMLREHQGRSRKREPEEGGEEAWKTDFQAWHGS